MGDSVTANKTHNLVRFVKDPKELGRSPMKLLYDKSLPQEVDFVNKGNISVPCIDSLQLYHSNLTKISGLQYFGVTVRYFIHPLEVKVYRAAAA